MKRNRILYWCSLLATVLTLPCWATADSIRVAALFDGPSGYFDELLEVVQTETSNLTDLDIVFALDERFNANWEVNRIAPILDAALADPAVDIVFAAGWLMAQEAARPDRDLSKPVVAGFPQDAALGTFPVKDHFSFVISEARVTRDVAQMHELFTMDTLHILVDEALAKHMDGVDALTRQLADELAMPVELVLVRDDPEAALQAVPDDVQALYITPLVRMDATARKTLFAALAERGVPTFSILGATDVRLGALAGLAPETQTRLARRLALNVIALAAGRPATDLPTEFSVVEQLVVNEETMRRTGYRQPMGVLLQAHPVAPPAPTPPAGEVLTLHDALARALLHNVQLDRSAAERAAAEYDRRQIRSTLFPQLDGQAAYLEIDRDRAAASFGLEPRNRTTAGARARQVLFDDELFSRIRAAGHQVDRAEWEAEETRLAVVEKTALRFFDALAATALLRVERDELERIRDHLELAQLRVDIGQTGREDVLRWKAEQARLLASVLAAEARQEAAYAALNQAMGISPETTWQLEAVHLSDTATYFLDEELRFVTSDVRDIRALTGFWQQWALRHSPTLQALDAALAAQETLANAKRRARYLPTIGLQAGYDHVIDRRTAGPDLTASLTRFGFPIEATDAPDHEWNVALVAEIPLFDGGRRRAGAARAQAGVQRLDALRTEVQQQTELAVIAAYQQVMASQPAIRLSRQRARAAADSLQLVQERYQEGTTGILDLLDVQGRAFAAEQAAVLAVNRYLQDLTRFQRAIAWFAWLQPDSQKEALATAAGAYLEQKQ